MNIEPLPIALVDAKPIEIVEFVTRLCQHIKTPSTEYVVNITDFLHGPKETIVSLFCRFNQCAVIVVKDHTVTSEVLALKFLSILLGHIAP